MSCTVITRATYNQLPKVNRAVARMMMEDGLLAIVESDAKQSFRATEA
ncbi:MAG: hypothetical protein LLF90_09350 [Methanomicrobiaceae archaeon]|nr:hypothetical protein [Methanomicrobiaceae archaeon]